MSTFNKLTWPISDVAAVCALQNGTPAAPLLLNGTLLNASIPDQISFARANMIRSVSLTSVNNLSAVNFIVQGLQNNAYVTETFGPAGTSPSPNNNTVYGTKHYDIITSVTVSAPVTAVSVGTGRTGYFPLLVVNPTVTSINYSAHILLPLGSGINYSLLQTLDTVINNFIPLDNQITKFFPFMGLTNKTTTEFESATNISNFLLFKINSSTNPLTDTFNFIFLQQ